MDYYPKLSTPLLLTLISALMLALAWREEKWPDWLRLILVITGVVVMFFALCATLDFLSHRYAVRVSQLASAKARSDPRVIMLDKISRMTPEQLAQARVYVADIGITANPESGPTYHLRLPVGDVPLDFVTEFINGGRDGYLKPIRDYSEGGKEREWAGRLTSYFVFNGWAEEARGNNAARWTNYDAMERAIYGTGA